MNLSGYVTECSWLRTALKRTSLALAASFIFVSLAHAEHFRSSQSVAIEADNASLSKNASEPQKVKGGLTAKGAGLFQTGSNQQEVVVVTLITMFEGTPTQLVNHQTAILSFADGSTIRFESDGKANGKRGTYKIISSQGTGRFKGIKASGVVRGTAFDPSLSYVFMEGDFETP
jgi:hypothetical protein